MCHEKVVPIQAVSENTDTFISPISLVFIDAHTSPWLQLIGHHWKFVSIANDHYLTLFPNLDQVLAVATTSGQTEFGPTARCFQNSAALLERHCPHVRADRSLQLGDVSGFTFVGSFLDMTPEVEIRRREVRRPHWPPDGGASGDEPPPPQRSWSHSSVALAA